MEDKKNISLVLAEHRRLVTERLILRPITLNDAEDMYLYASNDQVTRFIFSTHVSLADTKENIAVYFLKEPLGKYGIELKLTGQMIGSIDLRVNETQQTAELGYCLNQNFWGQGLIAEAGTGLLKMGFETLGLIRIFAIHDERNSNSGRVMQKLGMTKNGRIENSRFFKGEVVNDILYGLSKEGYLAGKVKKGDAV